MALTILMTPPPRSADEVACFGISLGQELRQIVDVHQGVHRERPEVSALAGASSVTSSRRGAPHACSIACAASSLVPPELSRRPRMTTRSPAPAPGR